MNVGDIVNQQQGAGLQAAGYKIVQVGIDAFGNATYQIVAAPAGLGANGYSATGYGTSGSGTSSSSGTTDTSGTSTRSLPPEIKKQLDDFIASLTGKKDFGYTPEELAQMMIDGSEGRDIQNVAQAPIAGAADKARQGLLNAAAARGGYAPGLNATTERVQQEEGRQSSEAVTQARLGIEAANRSAAIAAANARLTDSQGVRNQIGGLLQGYPEGTTSSRGTSTTTSTGTNTNASGPADTSGLVPGGVSPTAPVPGTTGAAIGGGSSGVRPKATGLSSTTTQSAPKKKLGLVAMLS